MRKQHGDQIHSHGKFLACPAFPECRNTNHTWRRLRLCPVCSSDIVIRKTKKVENIMAINNPDCEFMTWQKPSNQRCEKCGSVLLEKEIN